MSKKKKQAKEVEKIPDRLFMSRNTNEADSSLPVVTKLIRPLIRTKKYSDPAKMEEVINQYFIDCDTEERPYTIEGLALACGFSCTDTLRSYEKDEGYEAFHDLVRSAKLIVQKQRVESLQSGKMNAIAGIFLLVNGHKTDYKREPEMDESSYAKVLAGFNFVHPKEKIDAKSSD